MAQPSVPLPPPSLTHSILESSPHSFLRPTPQLHASFLQLAKHYLDPLASDITTAQELRRQRERESQKKRKRGDGDDERGEMLKMWKVYVDGFEVGQVWQQAKRVLEATGTEVERGLPNEENSEEDDGADESGEESMGLEDDGSEKLGVEYDKQVSDEDDSLGEEGMDWVHEGNDSEGLDSVEGSLDIGRETPPRETSDQDRSSPQRSQTLVKDKFGLNDGFFSIDEFNKQSQFLEQADSRGEAEGAASDEEEIDWDADPLIQLPQPAKHNRERSRVEFSKNLDELLNYGEDGGQDEDEEGGPTFRDMDLDAPEGDSDAEAVSMDEQMDGIGGLSNTNDIRYADFFAPPAQPTFSKKGIGKDKPRKPRTTKPNDPLPYGNSLVNEEGRDDEDADIERRMAAVHRDLFDEEAQSDLSGSEAEAEEGRTTAYSASKSLSSHEKRQLALREEIRKLEAANVSAKPWSLTGESLAPARPINSLLEEDLDFERAGKPVPVVTDSVNEGIESLIKRRILACEFDEVIRRRPTDLVTGVQQRRGRVEELSNAKPQTGLAEEYEDEHLRKTDPNYVDPRSETLKAKHAGIEKHWKAICNQLDSLCNWHYKPRPPEANMDVRVDVPRITMEDARPSGGDGAGESMLAPQEIYRTGDERRVEGEVMTKGGLNIAKEEETREQKKRRRSREKERNRKASGNAPPQLNGTSGKKTDPNKRSSKSDVLRQLKRGGVKVIGKKGELRDVEGQAVHDKTAKAAGGSFKL